MSVRLNVITRTRTLILMFLGLIFVSYRSEANETPKDLSLSEAKILVFASPFAEALRRTGTDIGVELQTSSELNQADYYYFWVYNAKRVHSGGSVTVGYYAINKHTADVWNVDTGRRESGRLLGDIQTVMRDAHAIEKSAVQRYQSNPP